MNINIFIKFGIGAVLSALIGLVLLPVLSWTVSPDVIGMYSLYLIALSILAATSGLGLDHSFLRIYGKTKNKSGVFWNFLLIGVLISSITIYLLAYLMGAIVDESPVKSSTYILLFFTIVSMIFIRYLSLVARIKSLGIIYSFSQCFPKVVFLFFLVYRMQYEKVAIEDIFLFLCISYAFTAVVLLYLLRNEVKFKRFHYIPLSPHFRFGLPILASSLIYMLMSAVDKLSLNLWADLEELGYYAILMGIAAGVSVFTNLFTTLWLPKIYNSSEVTAQKLVSNGISFGCTLVLLCVSLAGALSFIIPYILPDNYSFLKKLLAVAIIPHLFYALSEIPSSLLQYHNKTNTIFLSSFLALISNVALNFILVPPLGLRGAIMATSISYFIFFVVKTEISKKFLKEKLVYQSYLTLIFALLLSFYNIFNSNLFLLNWILIITFLISCILIFKSFKKLEVK